MSRFYAACDLGLQTGRVVLGNLRQDRFVLSELRRFEIAPLKSKEREWDITRIYGDIVEGLRSVGASQEQIQSVSCCSWPGDYVLFEGDRTIISPVYQHTDARTQSGIDVVQKRLNWPLLFSETGMQRQPHNTIFQLAAESARRLRNAGLFLPIADSFNYLLSGMPKAEMTLASATQLFNPRERRWSGKVMEAIRLSPKLFPALTPSGTDLGPLRAELAQDLRIEDARVIATCSDRLACAALGLPVKSGERWVHILPETWTTILAEVAKPIMTDVCRDSGYSNALGYGGTTLLHKQTVGLWLLEECQKQWGEADAGLDMDVLSHLAGSCPAFESLIDPADPRFLSPGDMLQKIQGYCKETNQVVPRKPGPIFRCILESLALMFRRMVAEIEYLSGAKLDCVYMGGKQAATHILLSHFTANALHIPVNVVPPDTVCMGNLVGQALTAGHLKDRQESYAVVQASTPTKSILPHGGLWDQAYDRLLSLKAA